MLNYKYGEFLDTFTLHETQIDIIDEIEEDKNDLVLGFVKDAYTDEIKDLIKRKKSEKKLMIMFLSF